SMVKVPTGTAKPGIGSLKFYYTSISQPGGYWTNQCVLDHVTMITAAATDGSVTEAPVASYSYSNSTQWHGGPALIGATKLGKQEVYSYGSSTFSITTDGQVQVQHDYTAGNVAITPSSSLWVGSCVTCSGAG